MDDKYANEIWNTTVKTAIQNLLRTKPTGFSFEELYRNIYTLVLHGHGEKVYRASKELITEYLIETVRDVTGLLFHEDSLMFSFVQAREEIAESSSVQFLATLKSKWDDYQRAMIMIRDILHYMNRVYVPAKQLDDSYNMGLILFRDHIIRFSSIRERLTSTLVNLLDDERRGEMIDKIAWKGIYRMLISLGMDTRFIYEENFQLPVLKQLAQFCQLRSQKLLVENSSSEYIGTVSALIGGVAQWTADCFDESTKTHIVQVLEDELIAKQMAKIMRTENAGIVQRMKSIKQDQLETIYQHFERFANGHSTISDCVGDYLRDMGTALIINNGEEGENLNAMVQSLLELKDTFNIFRKISTKYGKTLKQRIQLELMNIVNLNQHIAEHLSSLIVERMKRGVKCLSSEEVMELVKQMILLYYSKEKSVFEQHYDDFRQQMLKMIPHINEDKNTDNYVKVTVNRNFHLVSNGRSV